MPKCPNCEKILGIWDGGFICPKCFRCFKPNEARYFDGFDIRVVMVALELYEMFLKFGFVEKGRADIEFVDGYLLFSHIQHKG